MRKHSIITGVFVALVATLVVTLVTTPEALAYHEDPEIDMQYTTNPTIGKPVTIDCTKDTSTEFDILMTVFRYQDRVLYSIVESAQVVSYTLTPQDSSMIQIFCEYIDDKENKVGYAVMRTFTPR